MVWIRIGIHQIQIEGTISFETICNEIKTMAIVKFGYSI